MTPVVIHAQYWDGLRFTNSTTDSISSFTSGNVILSVCKKTLIDQNKAAIAPDAKGRQLNCNTSVALSGITATTFKLKTGATQFKLKAPGPGNTGSVDVSVDAAAWLPSTTGRFVFGTAKAGPVIYMGEIY